MIDAVCSYHLTPLSCGVAKFDQLLAQKLGVPWRGLHEASAFRHPLISAKFSEWVWQPPRPHTYSLFLHDLPKTSVEHDWVSEAVRVYAGNTRIARSVRRTSIAAWCPSTLQGNPSRGAFRVLIFGMSHKVAPAKMRDLKAELDAQHPDYTVSLSMAIHEGVPWAGTYQETVQGLREVFGDKLRVLGLLADDALAREIQDADVVALYYDPAVRANNTTAWSVLEAGKPLWTNVDHDSPVLDVQAHSWDKLVELMRA